MAVEVVVDTETTGLGLYDRSGPRPDGVVQVGLAWRHPSRGVQSWERLCNPGAEFLEDGRADFALQISGITRDQVLSAPSTRIVARELSNTLARIERSLGKVQLLAFNVEFDKSFLTVEPWNIRTGWGPCLMVAAAQLFGARRGRISLQEASGLVGVKVEGRPHTAAVDAQTALLLHEYVSGVAKRGDKKAVTQGHKPRPPAMGSGYREGCELCENTGPHSGPHGYFQEGDFYSLEN